MPDTTLRVEVSIPHPATLAHLEALARAARDRGLPDDAVFAAYAAATGPLGLPGSIRFDRYAVRGEFRIDADPEPPQTRLTGGGQTWAVSGGGANTTTALVSDAVRRGLAEPGIDRVVLDRRAATMLVGAPLDPTTARGGF